MVEEEDSLHMPGGIPRTLRSRAEPRGEAAWEEEEVPASEDAPPEDTERCSVARVCGSLPQRKCCPSPPVRLQRLHLLASWSFLALFLALLCLPRQQSCPFAREKWQYSFPCCQRLFQQQHPQWLHPCQRHWRCHSRAQETLRIRFPGACFLLILTKMER